MDKERFLDVNGFNSEYDIPLEKRMNKYRKRYRSEGQANAPVVPVTERLQAQSDAWWKKTRHQQAVSALVAAVLVAIVILVSCYLTFWL